MSQFEVGLICSPYYCSKHTGKGTDRYAYEILKYLSIQKIDVKVFHTGNSQNLYEASARLLFFPLKLLQKKADIYHATNPIGAISALGTRKRPLVTTIHDMIPFYFGGIKRAFQRICIESAARESDKIIVPYHVTLKDLISRFDVPREKINVINYGIDHRFFFPRKVEKGPKKIILYIGEIIKRKGVNTLIHAFSLARSEVEHSELLIGGKGKDLNEMKDLAKRLNVADDVKFLGYVPEQKLPEYYSLADVSIFPSRFGFGLPTLEAMACGSPTIAGNALDASEFLGDAGILINPEKPDELAKAIVKVLTATNSEVLSRKSIEKAKQYSWNIVGEKTLKLYEDLYSASIR